MYFIRIASEIIVFGGVKLLTDIANNEDTACRRDFLNSISVKDKYLVESLRLSLNLEGNLHNNITHYADKIKAQLLTDKL